MSGKITAQKLPPCHLEKRSLTSYKSDTPQNEMDTMASGHTLKQPHDLESTTSSLTPYKQKQSYNPHAALLPDPQWLDIPKGNQNENHDSNATSAKPIDSVLPSTSERLQQQSRQPPSHDFESSTTTRISSSTRSPPSSTFNHDLFKFGVDARAESTSTRDSTSTSSVTKKYDDRAQIIDLSPSSHLSSSTTPPNTTLTTNTAASLSIAASKTLTPPCSSPQQHLPNTPTPTQTLIHDPPQPSSTTTTTSSIIPSSPPSATTRHHDQHRRRVASARTSKEEATEKKKNRRKAARKASAAAAAAAAAAVAAASSSGHSTAAGLLGDVGRSDGGESSEGGFDSTNRIHSKGPLSVLSGDGTSSKGKEAKERLRLMNLFALKLYDLNNEPQLSAITKITARLLEAEVCILGIIDSRRVKWISVYNQGQCQLPVGMNSELRANSFCQYVIRDDKRGGFVILDAHKEKKFCEKSLAKHGLAFYAGAPLVTTNGTKIGTLSIRGSARPAFTAADAELLRQMTEWAVRELELISARRNMDSREKLHLARERILGLERTTAGNTLAPTVGAKGGGRIEDSEHYGNIKKILKITQATLQAKNALILCIEPTDTLIGSDLFCSALPSQYVESDAFHELARQCVEKYCDGPLVVDKHSTSTQFQMEKCLGSHIYQTMSELIWNSGRPSAVAIVFFSETYRVINPMEEQFFSVAATSISKLWQDMDFQKSINKFCKLSPAWMHHLQKKVQDATLEFLIPVEKPRNSVARPSQNRSSKSRWSIFRSNRDRIHNIQDSAPTLDMAPQTSIRTSKVPSTDNLLGIDLNLRTSKHSATDITTHRFSSTADTVTLRNSAYASRKPENAVYVAIIEPLLPSVTMRVQNNSRPSGAAALSSGGPSLKDETKGPNFGLAQGQAKKKTAGLIGGGAGRTGSQIQQSDPPSTGTSIWGGLGGEVAITPNGVMELIVDFADMVKVLADKAGLEHIINEGNLVMVAAGLNNQTQAFDLADFSLELMETLREYTRQTGIVIEASVGIHGTYFIPMEVDMDAEIYDLWTALVGHAFELRATANREIIITDVFRAALSTMYDCLPRKTLGALQTFRLERREVESPNDISNADQVDTASYGKRPRTSGSGCIVM